MDTDIIDAPPVVLPQTGGGDNPLFFVLCIQPRALEMLQAIAVGLPPNNFVGAQLVAGSLKSLFGCEVGTMGELNNSTYAMVLHLPLREVIQKTLAFLKLARLEELTTIMVFSVEEEFFRVVFSGSLANVPSMMTREQLAAEIAANAEAEKRRIELVDFLCVTAREQAAQTKPEEPPLNPS